MAKSYRGNIRSGGKVAIVTVPKAHLHYEELSIGDEVEVTIQKVNQDD